MSTNERKGHQPWSLSKFWRILILYFVGFVALMWVIGLALHKFVPPDSWQSIYDVMVGQQKSWPDWSIFLLVTASIGLVCTVVLGIGNRRYVEPAVWAEYRGLIQGLAVLTVIIAGSVQATVFVGSQLWVSDIPFAILVIFAALLFFTLFFLRGNAHTDKDRAYHRGRSEGVSHFRMAELPAIKEACVEEGIELGRQDVLLPLVHDRLVLELRRRVHFLWRRPRGSKNRSDYFLVQDHGSQISFAIKIGSELSEVLAFPASQCKLVAWTGGECRIKSAALDLTDLSAQELKGCLKTLEDDAILLALFKRHVMGVEFEINSNYVLSRPPTEIVVEDEPARKTNPPPDSQSLITGEPTSSDPALHETDGEEKPGFNASEDEIEDALEVAIPESPPPRRPPSSPDETSPGFRLEDVEGAPPPPKE